ncbi:MAG: decarboxylating NADP(+)-dependent phosphogluconate dehydrogenase [Defluviitaleaceae bacterium]|nr:decarboxylating NADP(+)-dependent phosphogluconate dehydrogenase [Defluviitaleaceae bacterium]
MQKQDIGLIGLAVMGENLCLNMESKGFSVSVYNRTSEKTENFTNGRAKGKNIKGFTNLEDFVSSLAVPRKIMLMVKAGEVVDKFINSLLPHLQRGDIIIDGGNSHYEDTNRRVKELEEKGFLYVGAGVSGGEEGALLGPSIMPGGSKEAWVHLEPIFKAISAKVDGEPCCEWIGSGGSGHFVKMVHNGIEYGDMQLICEAYHMLLKFIDDSDKHAEIFKNWNEGVLNSYLIEITADILAYKEDGKPLVHNILDKAGQKGTGKWTAAAAFELGSPLTMISEAVFARVISSLKDERVEASKILKGPKPFLKIEDTNKFIDSIEKGLYASKIVSYAQGYDLMKRASKEWGWNLNLGEIAMLWRGGCIIRSAFLNDIKNAYSENENLQNLLLSPFFSKACEEAQASWRSITSTAIFSGTPIPAFLSAITYYDSYRAEKLPANLLQAQRDYFGAHTYELLDKPGEFFHTNWTGRGGDTSSSTYNV